MTPRRKSDLVQFQLRLPAERLEILRRMADERGTNVSDIIRAAVADYLRRQPKPRA